MNWVHSFEIIAEILKLQNFQSKFKIQKLVSKRPNMHVPDAWTLDDNIEQGLKDDGTRSGRSRIKPPYQRLYENSWTKLDFF